MNPPVPGSPDRRMMIERRASVERRVGDRRHQLVPVARERRRSPDRRRAYDRRETASGHVRNAVQLLENVVSERELPPDTDRAVRQAIERLWMGLREIERLAVGRRTLGLVIRREGQGTEELDRPAGR